MKKSENANRIIPITTVDFMLSLKTTIPNIVGIAREYAITSDVKDNKPYSRALKLHIIVIENETAKTKEYINVGT
jgi:hypothetical protein